MIGTRVSSRTAWLTPTLGEVHAVSKGRRVRAGVVARRRDGWTAHPADGGAPLAVSDAGDGARWLAHRLAPKGRRGDAGFTLIELMVVVAIIGILAATTIPRLTAARTASADEQARAAIVSWSTGADQMWASWGVWPDSIPEFTALMGTPPATGAGVHVVAFVQRALRDSLASRLRPGADRHPVTTTYPPGDEGHGNGPEGATHRRAGRAWAVGARVGRHAEPPRELKHLYELS